jgi:Trk K+ transport system NAD-binding subunit
VLGIALYAFRAGVEVSQVTNLPEASGLTHFYYALGLFVLGGLDLGTPRGGPLHAQVLLWIAYFGAPAITTSAVAEAVLRIIGSGWLERVGLRGHVVIVGLGRLGTRYVAALHRRDPGSLVVAVDRDVGQASVIAARRRFGVRVVAGDVRVKGLLPTVSLGTAKAVALLTDDDLLNLELAFRIARDHPALPIVAHVTDIGMQRVVAELRRDAPRTNVRVFNAHHVAARQLFEEHLRAHFASTAPRDVVVLAGFGRFGQTILEYLEQHSGKELRRVVIVDRKATVKDRVFREQTQMPAPCEVKAVDGDADDPETWNTVAAAMEEKEPCPVVIVGCDDDHVNIRAAMHLRRRWPAARIFVRCQSESSFTEQLSERYDLTVLAIEAMLDAALADVQPGA